MTKILFICHGNICRSAAAEVVFRQKTEETGLGDMVVAGSAAATREETGNDIYPPMKKTLIARGYMPGRHAARQTVREDYGKWDKIVCMDRENIDDMLWIYGGDPQGKLSLLLDWAGKKGSEIEDPWYTRRFDSVLTQIENGCDGLLEQIIGDMKDNRL